MNKPYNSMLELIGNSPMVKLKKISKNIPAEIWAKLELNNPSGSVKDRIAIGMLEQAEKRGLIKPGATIVEPTSGNTGIALSMVCALKGYKMIAVLPEAMSMERRNLMHHYGAKVVVVPSAGNPKDGFTKEDIENTMKKAEEIVKKTKNAFMPNQFDNMDNPKVHAKTTAKEIIKQTNGGKFHAYVAACGTGGTFSGVADVLKKKYPKIKRYVVEPANSAVMSGDEPGFHKIQGIGEGFVPGCMDTSLADGVIKVPCETAMKYARILAQEEGILCGISSGANVHAALQVGKKMKKGQIIVTIIPDNACRYFTTELFEKV